VFVFPLGWLFVPSRCFFVRWCGPVSGVVLMNPPAPTVFRQPHVCGSRWRRRSRRNTLSVAHVAYQEVKFYKFDQIVIKNY
jgi:hypothetical protein